MTGPVIAQEGVGGAKGWGVVEGGRRRVVVKDLRVGERAERGERGERGKGGKGLGKRLGEGEAPW